MALTLENISEVESLHRTDFYRLMTGQDPEFSFGSTKLPPWKPQVRPDNMDQVMTAVEKFEKRHGGVGYYGGHCERIREAYTTRNYDAFQQEIAELLVSINWD